MPPPPPPPHIVRQWARLGSPSEYCLCLCWMPVAYASTTAKRKKSRGHLHGENLEAIEASVSHHIDEDMHVILVDAPCCFRVRKHFQLYEGPAVAAESPLQCVVRCGHQAEAVHLKTARGVSGCKAARYQKASSAAWHPASTLCGRRGFSPSH